MRKQTSAITGVLVTLVIIVGPLGLFFSLSKAIAQNTGWMSAADPTISNQVINLPANLSPIRANQDCTPLNYLTTLNNVYASGCFANSAAGRMDMNGAAILEYGTVAGVPITSTASGQYGTDPIPNQSMVLSQTSAPVVGSYLHFYTDFLGALNLHTDLHGNRWYTVDKQPNVDFVDKTNHPVVTNPGGTLSYSSNGDWMVVDSPNGAFLRVNLATFDVVPFTQSLNTNLDYSLHIARTAVSDDGRYVAVASYDYSYFKVFDISTCSGTVSNTYSAPLNCQSRDYWPYISAHVHGFRNIYSVRFTNDDNLNFDATYDYVPGTGYDAARFTMTSPGAQAHGIDYLALGDSYISGQGTFQYKQGTDTANNTCHLSTLSYPYIVGASIENSYESIACSGATTDDIKNSSTTYNIKNPQSHGKSDKSYDDEIYSSFLPGYRAQIQFIKRYTPKIVTLSIGGNDVGFSDIMKSCVVPQFGDQTCYDSYADRLSLVKTISALFSTLQQTYQDILTADPGVQLYVVGYPQVAVQGTCALNVHLDSSEIQFSQQLIAYLDSIVQRAASSVGVRYVDIQNALAGHRLCEAKNSAIAINGVTAGNDGGTLGIKLFGSESFHPNVLGHELLAQKVLQLTNNFKQSMPAADSSITALASNDPLIQALLNGYQPDGPTIETALYGDSDMPEVMLRGSTSQVTVSSQPDSLNAGSVYSLVLHSDPTNLGTLTADATGSLTGAITIPASTAVGFHTLHMYGQDTAGQQIDIYKVVYVAASTDDYDGDGVTNNADQCLVTPLSKQDVDQDGIDDACDANIGEPPNYGHKYPATATLFENSILVQGGNN